VGLLRLGLVPDFKCIQCGKSFAVSDAALARFPGWSPKKCLTCKGQTSKRPRPASNGSAFVDGAGQTTSNRVESNREENLTVGEILAKYHDGPKSGVFTDGAASPNPGPGGWGAVYVVDDHIVEERWGHEAHTTNNRMELMALRTGITLVPVGTETALFTDSQLCVNTFTKWAQNWAARNWRRKDGEIKNLELVQEIYYALKQRPEIELRWIAAHNGQRYNEYADSLATAYRRSVR
jgi:ribonuclease HI